MLRTVLDAPAAAAFATAAMRCFGGASGLVDDFDLHGLRRIALGLGVRGLAPDPRPELPCRGARHEAVAKAVLAGTVRPRRAEGPPLVAEEHLQVDHDSTL